MGQKRGELLISQWEHKEMRGSNIKARVGVEGNLEGVQTNNKLSDFLEKESIPCGVKEGRGGFTISDSPMTALFWRMMHMGSTK